MYISSITKVCHLNSDCTHSALMTIGFAETVVPFFLRCASVIALMALATALAGSIGGPYSSESSSWSLQRGSEQSALQDNLGQQSRRTVSAVQKGLCGEESCWEHIECDFGSFKTSGVLQNLPGFVTICTMSGLHKSHQYEPQFLRTSIQRHLR